MKRALALAAVIIVVVIVLFYSLGSLYSATLLKDLPEGGLGVYKIDIDYRGDFRTAADTYKSNIQLPVIIDVDGRSGMIGHVSHGKLDMRAFSEAIGFEKVGVKITLNNADITTDAGLIRCSIATAWIPSHLAVSSQFRYYLEFDIWNSPLINSIVSLSSYYSKTYDDQNRPVILVKAYQLQEGKETSLIIDFHKGFSAAYQGVDAILDQCYIVVEKTDAASQFSFEMQFEEMVLYE